MNTYSLFRSIILNLALIAMVGCAHVKVEENQIETVSIETDDMIAVLGRRHASSYDTENTLVDCVVSSIARGGARVIGGGDLADQLYPWLEPRVAPLRIEAMLGLLHRPGMRDKIDQLGLKYLVWIDGSTQTTDSTGQMSCTISPGAAGCYGIAIWTNEASYDVTIWDIDEGHEVNRVLVEAEGTSYMPAIVVPVPLIARVQNRACKGIGNQIREYFSS